MELVHPFVNRVNRTRMLYLQQSLVAQDEGVVLILDRLSAL